MTVSFMKVTFVGLEEDNFWGFGLNLFRHLRQMSSEVSLNVFRGLRQMSSEVSLNVFRHLRLTSSEVCG